MSTAMHYQPWLQAVLTIAKHYRIEASEERLRLQLDRSEEQSSCKRKRSSEASMR